MAAFGRVAYLREMEITLFSSPELKSALSANARLRRFAKDEILIRAGEEIAFIPIVLKGCVRVLREDEQGREIFLYYLLPGETCALSLTCCQAGAKSMVRAVTEEETELLQVPVKLTEEWYKFPEWKAFVSANYNDRFARLIHMIDLIAFSKMDEQVLNYLQQRARALGRRVLPITHQQVAEELNTHREAITRLLKTLEKKGHVRLGRNSIEILTLL